MGGEPEIEGPVSGSIPDIQDILELCRSLNHATHDLVFQRLAAKALQPNKFRAGSLPQTKVFQEMPSVASALSPAIAPAFVVEVKSYPLPIACLPCPFSNTCILEAITTFQAQVNYSPEEIQGARVTTLNGTNREWVR